MKTCINHPDVKHVARQLCRNCYQQWLLASNPEYKARQTGGGNKWKKDKPDEARAAARRWHKTNSEKRKSSVLKYKYGISLEQRDAMLSNQGNCCAICKSVSPNTKHGWHTDHCHASGSVRGILCRPCNHMLGHARDNVTTLAAAIDYLKKE